MSSAERHSRRIVSSRRGPLKTRSLAGADLVFDDGGVLAGGLGQNLELDRGPPSRDSSLVRLLAHLPSPRVGRDGEM